LHDNEESIDPGCFFVVLLGEREEVFEVDGVDCCSDGGSAESRKLR
jgi:hypothetical protein